MAVINDAMSWYTEGGVGQTIRPKYLFSLEIYAPGFQEQSRLVIETVRTVDLPKYSIEVESVNAWNVRQNIPTRVSYEPITLTFNDTKDNKFQDFLTSYLNTSVTNFNQSQVNTSLKSMRTGLDGFGLKMLSSQNYNPINKIVINRYYGTENQPITVWNPRIVDIQHDTLDYAVSEALTWSITLRYEAVTYDETEK